MRNSKPDLLDVWEEIREDPCFEHLRTEFTNFVPGRGNTKNPKVMILGEAPGNTENVQRQPFVGMSGKLLDSLIASAGIDIRDVFITNTVKYRPPMLRAPSTKEIKDSLPYIRKEWRAVGSPRVIITLGATPLACLAKEKLPVSDSAGKPYQMNGTLLTLWPMFHPAYALRNKAIRPTVEAHWEALGLWWANHNLREEQ